jgi:hypothetical protein
MLKKKLLNENFIGYQYNYTILKRLKDTKNILEL